MNRGSAEMAKGGDALSATDPLAQKAYWKRPERRAMSLQSDVLDLGCGDGSFANTVLARRFRAVDGFDFAEPAVSPCRSKCDRAEHAYYCMQYHSTRLCTVYRYQVRSRHGYCFVQRLTMPNFRAGKRVS
jgi:SAM-dependent methyltransferase